MASTCRLQLILSELYKVGFIAHLSIAMNRNDCNEFGLDYALNIKWSIAQIAWNAILISCYLNNAHARAYDFANSINSVFVCVAKKRMEFEVDHRKHHKSGPINLFVKLLSAPTRRISSRQTNKQMHKC